MRLANAAVIAGVAAALGGCGGGGVVAGPPVVTGEGLGDSLAVAARDDLEARGIFGVSVGEQGGLCRGRDARWKCTLQIVVTATGSIRDQRTYDMRVDGKGCWVARQTGTDVGETGTPSRPERPGVLKGCLR